MRYVMFYHREKWNDTSDIFIPFESDLPAKQILNEINKASNLINDFVSDVRQIYKLTWQYMFHSTHHDMRKEEFYDEKSIEIYEKYGVADHTTPYLHICDVLIQNCFDPDHLFNDFDPTMKPKNYLVDKIEILTIDQWWDRYKGKSIKSDY